MAGRTMADLSLSALLFDPMVLIGLLIALPVCYAIYQLYLHPLAAIPGPFWAKFSRLWMTKHSWDGDMSVTMIALHKQHGSLVRTGPNEVSVSDLGAIKTIYGAGTRFRKSDWSVILGRAYMRGVRMLLSTSYSLILSWGPLVRALARLRL